MKYDTSVSGLTALEHPTWLLTEEEAKKAVDKWLEEDFPVRAISLNQGHWEDVVFVIAYAQARKLVRDLKTQLRYNISAGSQLDLFESPYWKALRKEIGLEEEKNVNHSSSKIA